MRLVFIFALSLFLLGLKTDAQVNLVPNPSFEVYDSCPYDPPTWYYGIEYAIPWFQPFTPGSSTDYFNNCSSDTTYGVPFNAGGFQMARSGVAYGGFTTGIILPPNNSREYLEVELNDSLIAGNKYCVKFYVNFADVSRRATDGFGAYLSRNNVQYSSPQLYVLSNLIPQILNPVGNIIEDTLNWVEISGDFYATGGEKYLTIGNFKDDAHTLMIQNNYGTIIFSYYYIDDVSVVLCDSTTGINEINWIKNFNVSPNPVKHILNLNNLPNTQFEMLIYDLQGKLVISSQHNKITQPTNQINVSELGSGLYIIKINSSYGSVVRKFVKE